MKTSIPRHAHAIPSPRVPGCAACAFFAERDRMMDALCRQTRAGQRPGIDWTWDTQTGVWSPPEEGSKR